MATLAFPSFRQHEHSFVAPFDDVDIRTWPPGDVCLERAIRLPQDLKPGLAELSAGLIDPKTGQAKVSFVNKHRFTARWQDLGKFGIL